jgi:hypothetical protein
MKEQELVNIHWFKRHTLLGMMESGEIYTKYGNTDVFIKMPYSRYALNKAVHLENVFAEKVKVGVSDER